MRDLEVRQNGRMVLIRRKFIGSVVSIGSHSSNAANMDHLATGEAEFANGRVTSKVDDPQDCHWSATEFLWNNFLLLWCRVGERVESLFASMTIISS